MTASSKAPRSAPDPALFEAAEACFSASRPLLLAWFERHARALPWRVPHPGGALAGVKSRRSPYAVWISEVMLQQTQVATVIPYFERWMALFPDPAALAAAPEETVLRAWAGLGYYARARNLQKAARSLAEQGTYPATAEGWKALPGVGDYTAGAIASLALGQRAPILDGNVARVFSRLLGLGFLPGENAAARRAYWDLAARWAAHDRPGAVNEALMELGALVCVPASPRCGECPLSAQCRARRHGWENRLPPAKPRAKTEVVAAAAVLVLRGGSVLTERRGAGAFLAGHELFPFFLGEEAKDWRAAFARRFPGCALKRARAGGAARHSIMSKRYDIEIWICEAAGATGAPAPGTDWSAAAGLEERLTNSLARKIWKAAGIQRRARLPSG